MGWVTLHVYSLDSQTDIQNNHIVFYVLRIDYNTIDITTVKGDFELDGSFTLHFQDSSSDTLDKSIQIINDQTDEGPEIFKIMLHSPSEGAIIEPSEAIVLILDTADMPGMFKLDMLTVLFS